MTDSMTEIYIALSIIGVAITFFLLLHEHRKDFRYKKQKEWLNKK